MNFNVLSINGNPEDKEGLTEIFCKASKFFPHNLVEDVNYLGCIGIEQDVEMNFKGNSYRAFLIRSLKRKLNYIKNSLESSDPLLGITSDPVIQKFGGYENGIYHSIAVLVKDYVDSEIGVFSFFDVEEEVISPMTAHGVGHSCGLVHHRKPVGLMYHQLFVKYSKDLDGFCDGCMEKLRNLKRSL